jgi:hypothetical protein
MTTDIAKAIDAVKADYEGAILTVLTDCAETLTKAGFYADEPYDMCGDEYRWTFSVWRTPERGEIEDSIDVSLEIAEAATYGDEPESGINFGLDVVEWGGRILGGMTPFNYTDECWVDAFDEEAVAERWSYFEAIRPEELVQLIQDDMERSTA